MPDTGADVLVRVVVRLFPGRELGLPNPPTPCSRCGCRGVVGRSRRPGDDTRTDTDGAPHPGDQGERTDRRVGLTGSRAPLAAVRCHGPRPSMIGTGGATALSVARVDRREDAAGVIAMVIAQPTLLLTCRTDDVRTPASAVRRLPAPGRAHASAAPPVRPDDRDVARSLDASRSVALI